NCKTCSIQGNNEINNCDSCASDRFFIEPKYKGNCDLKSDIPSDYYYDEVNQIYKQCYSSCATCSIGYEEDEINNKVKHNCKTCKENYFFENDKRYNCINDAGDGFYLDFDTFYPCYESCQTCIEGINGIIHNCISCNDTYYWFSLINSNCIKKEEKPEDYYLDWSDNTIKRCSLNCKTCDKGSDQINNNCLSCIDEYYFLEPKENGNCISVKPDKYYLDIAEGTYKQCHSSCASCSYGFDDLTKEHNCESCIDGYNFLNATSTICTNVIEDGWFNDNGVLKQCHASCYKCNEGYDIDTGKHNCLECNPNYHFISTEQSNCITINEMPTDHYFDNTQQAYLPCKDSCSTCSKGDSCLTCQDGYVFIGEKDHGHCILTDKVPPNYYYNTEEGTYKQCYRTCKTCDKGGDWILNINNCITCLDNYYFDNTSSNCINVLPNKHYWDIDQGKYWPCYDTCATCSKGGDDTYNNCDSCVQFSHWIYGHDKNCWDREKKPQNYYYNSTDDMFKPCHKNCLECTKGEDLENRKYNCKVCKE
ncbi:MAG: hypothetical protein ACRC42_03965, partial [Mycoplasma sp.]